jgi:hypothetical protein
MDPANDEKIDRSHVLSGNRLIPSSDLEQLKTLEEAAKKDNKMARRIQNRLVAILLVTIFAIGAFSATTNNIARRNDPAPPPAEDLSRFQTLLDSIDPGHLHDILHTHLKGKYRHGVFEEDKKALEAVHNENEEVATSLVELAKRQDNNATTAAPPSPQTVTSTTAPTTTLPAPTVTSTSEAPSPPATTPSLTTSDSAPAPSPSTSATEAPSPTPTTEAPSPSPTTEAPSPSPTTEAPSPTPTTSAPEQPTTSPNSPTTPAEPTHPLRRLRRMAQVLLWSQPNRQVNKVR